MRAKEECPLLLATVEPLRRTKVIEELLGERVIRKSKRVIELWQRSDKDWNHVLFAMAAYALCAPRNSEAAEQLTSIVTFNMCMRERSNPRRVEALLLGASGLLVGEYYDDYIVALQDEFDYLANKYSIRPMSGGRWNRNNSLPAGNPVIRVAQLAALVSKRDFGFDTLVGCKTLNEVAALLDVEVSEYWCTHYVPQGAKSLAHRRIGRDKVNMMAINMVVPIQVAYADATRNVILKERAVDMLEKIPAEHNRVVGQWTGAGVPCSSAYDSQALVELQTICNEGRCRECPVEKQLRNR